MNVEEAQLHRGGTSSKLRTPLLSTTQGLGSDGIQLYVSQLRSAFLGAEESNEADGGEGGSAGGGAAAVEKARAWAVEQLCGAVQLPASSADTKAQALRFLATHAVFAGVPLKKHKAAKVGGHS